MSRVYTRPAIGNSFGTLQSYMQEFWNALGDLDLSDDPLGGLDNVNPRDVIGNVLIPPAGDVQTGPANLGGTGTVFGIPGRPDRQQHRIDFFISWVGSNDETFQPGIPVTEASSILGGGPAAYNQFWSDWPPPRIFFLQNLDKYALPQNSKRIRRGGVHQHRLGRE